MVAGSILPVAIHKNKLYFLFGKENEFADTPGFSDFGGGVDNNETPYKTALREGAEELTGFLGDETQLEELIQKNGGTYNISSGTYHIHIFFLHYDENLPKYYNQNHAFLWNRMNKRQLEDTKLFEKEEIRWFSVADMKKEKKSFREFYRDIVDILIKESNKIQQFISSRHRKTRIRHSMQKASAKTRKHTGGR